jgi:type IV pilus assembly protein PilP
MSVTTQEFKNALMSGLVYLAVGALGVGTAFYLSSLWLNPAQSQAPTDAPVVPPPDPTVSSPGAVPGSAQDLLRENFVAEVQSYLEPFIYDPKGRRDPFGPYIELQLNQDENFAGPLLPLQRFDVNELRLIGIMWNVKDPKAMFVDPNSQIHVVGKDYRVGRNNGYIAVIREGEVVIVEATRRKGDLIYSSRVVRLEQ